MNKRIYPKLSVIMSIYNEEEKWIRETINSILNQSFDNFELLIVYDCPKNKQLLDVLKQIKDKDRRINIIENKENIGLAKSLNKALDVSNGKFIARIDADDICEVERFEIQINFLMKNKQIDLLGTNISFIDENSDFISRDQKVIKDFYLIKKIIPNRNLFHHPTWMFRREILQKVKGYRIFPYSQDYDFICRCITSGLVCSNIDQKLVRYRLRSNSISIERRFQQGLIVLYIQKLFKERKNSVQDSFSSEHVEKIITKAEKLQTKYVVSEKKYENAKLYFNKRKLVKSIILFIQSFIDLPSYRYYRFRNGLIINIKRKIYKI